MPYAVLSFSVGIQCKNVLVIGGAPACIAAKAFLVNGADRVTVTGLDHISEEGHLLLGAKEHERSFEKR